MVNLQSAGKSTQPEAPQARAALDSMKYEIAKELGSRATTATLAPGTTAMWAATWSSA